MLLITLIFQTKRALLAMKWTYQRLFLRSLLQRSISFDDAQLPREQKRLSTDTFQIFLIISY